MDGTVFLKPHHFQRLDQSRNIDRPFFGIRKIGLQRLIDHLFENDLDHVMHTLAFEDLVALRVNDLALTAEHIIVIEQLLARIEVESFDTFLSHRDRFRHRL